MPIWGTDGSEVLKRRAEEHLSSGSKQMQVSVSTVLALVDYHKKLTAVCQHDFDISSPIDTMEVCRICGLVQHCDPIYLGGRP